MSGIEHGVTITEDEDMWPVTVCSCGWRSPACPDDETAVDVWGGHLVEAVLGDEPGEGPAPLDHPRWPDWEPVWIGQQVRYQGGTKVGPIVGIRTENETVRVWYSPHGGWFRLDEMVRHDPEDGER